MSQKWLLSLNLTTQPLLALKFYSVASKSFLVFIRLKTGPWSASGFGLREDVNG
jgi:hypothetical protein